MPQIISAGGIGHPLNTGSANVTFETKHRHTDPWLSQRSPFISTTVVLTAVHARRSELPEKCDNFRTSRRSCQVDKGDMSYEVMEQIPSGTTQTI